MSIFEFLGGLGWTSHSDKYLQKRQRVFHRNLIYGETGYRYLSPTHPSITTIMHSHLHDLPIKPSQLNMRGPSHQCRASALATSMHPTPTATNFPTRQSENTHNSLYTSATAHSCHNHQSSRESRDNDCLPKVKGCWRTGRASGANCYMKRPILTHPDPTRLDPATTRIDKNRPTIMRKAIWSAGEHERSLAVEVSQRLSFVWGRSRFEDASMPRLKLPL